MPQLTLEQLLSAGWRRPSDQQPELKKLIAKRNLFLFVLPSISLSAAIFFGCYHYLAQDASGSALSWAVITSLGVIVFPLYGLVIQREIAIKLNIHSDAQQNGAGSPAASNAIHTRRQAWAADPRARTEQVSPASSVDSASGASDKDSTTVTVLTNE